MKITQAPIAALLVLTVGGCAATAWQIPPEFQGRWIKTHEACSRYQDRDNWRQIGARTVAQHEQFCTLLHGTQPDAQTLHLQVSCSEEGETYEQYLLLKRTADGQGLRVGDHSYRFCGR